MLVFQIRAVDRDNKVIFYQFTKKSDFIDKMNYLILQTGRYIKRFTVNVIPNSDKFILGV